MKPIYKPKGPAAEYGDYAVNIYTGCPHRCFYCYAPQVLHLADTAEPGAIIPADRLYNLEAAKCMGIKTWVSFEPVLDPAAVLDCIKGCAYFIDKVKIGKLNYNPSDIPWAKFGRDAEAACREMGLDYYIKDSLREEMDKEG